MLSIIYAAEIDNVNGVATLQGIEGAFENVIGALLAAAGIVLFIILITGGIKYITSGGDPKGIESAKMTLTYGIIGIVLVALAYLVLVLISEFTGNTSLLNFRTTLITF